jgi:type IV pilus assembly protein PilN
MIRINLLPKEEKPSKAALLWRRIFIWTLIGSALVLVVGIGWHISRSYEISTLKADISDARVEQDKYRKEAEIVTELTQKRKMISQRIEVIEDLDKNRFLRVQLLDELARSVPEYIWLHSFQEAGGTVAIRGRAFSNLAISRFMDSLEGKTHVDSVYLQVIRKEQLDDTPILNFELGYQSSTAGEDADNS